MSFLETKHKRKSAVITSILLALILVGIFNFGMQYIDPPEEYGLAINFGDSNFGSGDPVVKTKANPAVKKVEEKVEKKEEVIPKETIKEKVITQDVKDAPVLEKLKKKKVEKPVETKKKIEKPKEVIKPKPSKETQDALNNLLKGNSKDRENKGEGDDDNSGLKGDKNGDPKATKYYGNNGSDGVKDYNLLGRNALYKPTVNPDCNQEGTVVVRIEVDRSGKVIKATPGFKGSTNTAPCLLKPAKEAALRTTWSPKNDAATMQIGTITYRFSLSE